MNSPKINLQDDSNNAQFQIVTFNIANEVFAADISNVQRINRETKITPIPNSSKKIVGVINIRDKVIPVVSLRKYFNLQIKEYDNDTRILLVEISSWTIGFLVDKVNEVLSIDKGIIESPPPLISTINTEYITSVIKHNDKMIIMIDLEKIILNEIYELISN